MAGRASKGKVHEGENRRSKLKVELKIICGPQRSRSKLGGLCEWVLDRLFFYNRVLKGPFSLSRTLFMKHCINSGTFTLTSRSIKIHESLKWLTSIHLVSNRGKPIWIKIDFWTIFNERIGSIFGKIPRKFEKFLQKFEHWSKSRVARHGWVWGGRVLTAVYHRLDRVKPKLQHGKATFWASKKRIIRGTDKQLIDD